MAQLFVGQLPFNKFYPEDLERIFAPYGAVIGRELYIRKGNGFVLFRTTDEADAAIAGLHGRYTVDGGRHQPIQVMYSKGTRLISPFGLRHRTQCMLTRGARDDMMTETSADTTKEATRVRSATSNEESGHAALLASHRVHAQAGTPPSVPPAFVVMSAGGLSQDLADDSRRTSNSSLAAGSTIDMGNSQENLTHVLGWSRVVGRAQMGDKSYLDRPMAERACVMMSTPQSSQSPPPPPSSAVLHCSTGGVLTNLPGQAAVNGGFSPVFVPSPYTGFASTGQPQPQQLQPQQPQPQPQQQQQQQPCLVQYVVYPSGAHTPVATTTAAASPGVNVVSPSTMWFISGPGQNNNNNSNNNNSNGGQSMNYPYMPPFQFSQSAVPMGAPTPMVMHNSPLPSTGMPLAAASQMPLPSQWSLAPMVSHEMQHYPQQVAAPSFCTQYIAH